MHLLAVNNEHLLPPAAGWRDFSGSTISPSALGTASGGRRLIPRQLESLMSESAIYSDSTNRGLSLTWMRLLGSSLA
jgi:hypothetical protein